MILVVVAVSALGWTAVQSIRTTTDLTKASAVADARYSYDQQTCLQAAVRRELPKGVPVIVRATGYQEYLLIQYLTLWDMPVSSKSHAHYAVSVVSRQGGCQGLALMVVRR